MQPHIRRSQCVIAMLAAMVSLPPPAGRADTMFWINDSGSNAGTPSIGILDPRGGTGYIWGRPDGDETLLNLSLNLVFFYWPSRYAGRRRAVISELSPS